MELLFFKSKKDIEILSNEIFGVLGVPPLSNHSSNVFKGIYFSANLLGMKVKLEYNSYDYEDDFNYMITIDKELISNLKIETSDIKYFTTIITNILSSNMKIQIAHEVNDKLELFNPYEDI